jgi:NAD(P)-dependent dehydrogenase (short-subunit alcohol dehydrogenase family)
MNRSQSKVAVITGGTSGIGLVAAEAFLRAGARVCVGRDHRNADQAKDLLGGDAGDTDDVLWANLSVNANPQAGQWRFKDRP